MVLAYRKTIGQAYPHRDPVAVFKVLGECASPLGTTQVAITRATAISTAEVNKIVGQASEKGWVQRENCRTSTGAKIIFLTESGRQILAEFDQRCLAACDALASPRSDSQAVRKRGRRSKSVISTVQTRSIFDVPGDQS
jgi:DNA-binding MarR family transcriptional regulator